MRIAQRAVPAKRSVGIEFHFVNGVASSHPLSTGHKDQPGSSC